MLVASPIVDWFSKLRAQELLVLYLQFAVFQSCCLAIDSCGYFCRLHASLLIFVLAVVAVIPIIVRSWTFSVTNAIAVMIVVSSFPLLTYDMAFTRLSGIALLLLGLAQISNRIFASVIRNLTVIPIATLVYWSLFVEPGSFFYSARSDMSIWLSEVFSGRVLRFNPTASGIDNAMLALIFVWVNANWNRSKLVFVAVDVILVLAIFGLFLFAISFVPSAGWFTPDSKSEVEIDSPSITTTFQIFSMYDATAVLSLVTGMAISFRSKLIGQTARQGIRYASGAVFASSLVVCFACVLLIWGSSQSSNTLERASIGIVSQWDTNTPEGSKPNLGVANTGMYGLLMEDLKSSGAKITKLTPDWMRGANGAIPNPLALMSGIDVLLMIVPTSNFSEAEVSKINEFLENGGRVVLVGDHTDLLGCMGPFNQISAPYGIELEFDSAFSHTKWWFRNIVKGIHLGYQENIWLDYGVGTGGSLTVSDRAIPLLVGKYAFGDIGNMSKTSMKDAFLGNYRYEHGETLGDMILMASAPVKKGEILCIGDSSMLQNISYPRTAGFVRHVLGTRHQNATESIRWLALQCCVALLAAFLAYTTNVERGAIPVWEPSLRICLFVALMLVSFAVPIQKSRKQPLPKQPNLFVVLNPKSSVINRDPFNFTSCMGLPTCLSRNGKTARFAYTLDEACAAEPEGIIIPGCLQKFSNSDQSTLRDYVERGGLLVLACGDDCKHSLATLLETTGIRVTSTPLGGDPFAESAVSPISFLDAYALAIDVSAGGAHPEVVMSRLEHPVICRVRIGEGTLVVIGDSKFFCDKNLESEKEFRRKNVDFIGEIIKK